MNIKRFILIIALIGSAIGLMVTPAYAQNPELCQNQANTSQCYNRSGGGTGIGTHVIGWSAGDPNDDFDFTALNSMCGNGLVTQICPFTVGSGLNSTYAGDQIVELFTPHGNHNGIPGSCVGAQNANDSNGSLVACPDANGNGGGWSSIVVLEYSKTNNNHLYYVLISVHWSDVNAASGQCNAFSCTIQEADCGPNQHGAQINLNYADVQVQNGNPGGSQNCDVWAEI